MVTKVKIGAKPVAKAKPAPVQEEVVEFNKGDSIVFNGYGDDVAEEERVLTEGETYTVSEVNDDGESVAVLIDNPDFNPKKRESESNAKQQLVDVFFNEISLATDDAGDDAGTDEDETAEEEAPPAKPARTASKVAAKTAAKVAAKPAAKPAAKDTTKATVKPAKGKLPAKAAAKEEEEDEFPTLDNEDQDIVELVEGTDDILGLAAELVEEGAALDYRLGGVLYHVRNGKAYESLGDQYKENGGFGLYVKDMLNIEYRKAMYLIDIYYKFNLFGIDAAKVQELGWTKCSKIAAVMTDDNAEALVELAEGSSVSDLNDAIKEGYKTEGGTKGVTRKKITFKFRLWEDQASAVSETLQATTAAMGFKTIDDAFEHIVMEWAAEHPVEAPAKASKATTSKVAAKPVAKATAKARG